MKEITGHIRVLKAWTFLVCFCLPLLSFSAKDIQQINIAGDFNRVMSIAEESYLIKAPSDASIYDVILSNDFSPEKFQNANPNLGFTGKTYFVAFKLHYEGTAPKEVYVQAARPITNHVNLYYVNEEGDLEKKVSGDLIDFSEKDVKSRYSMFNITLLPKDTRTYYMEVKSDGESLNLPIRIYDIEHYNKLSNQHQYVFGIFYGILFFVVIIYFFFYVALKAKSFFYYVIYVLSMLFLQLSLDGLFHQYITPGIPEIAGKGPLFFSSLSLIFVIAFARSFLPVRAELPKTDKFFKFFAGVGVLTGILSLFPFDSLLYQLDFILINAGSLISIFWVVGILFVLVFIKKVRIDPFFVAAYLLLVVGVTIFLLGNFNVIENNFFVRNAMKFGTGLEVIFLSLSMANKFREMQQEKTKAQQEAIDRLEEVNELTANMNVKLEKQVDERTREINARKEELSEKNKEIVDSIRYAQRIQNAILPPDSYIKKLLPSSFVYYRPKDIVSGDFYWAEKIRTNEGLSLVGFAVVDCTGHGVPGAFMSIMGNDILQRALTEPEVNSPAQALDYLNKGVKELLRTDYDRSENLRDGMDLSFCVYDEQGTVYFAGAHNGLYLVRKNSTSLNWEKDGEQQSAVPAHTDGDYALFEIPADRRSIGNTLKSGPFSNNKIEVKKGDRLYLFTDGYPDQFGGPKGKKFKYKAFKRLLLSFHTLSMEEQAENLNRVFDKWIGSEGEYEQIDDICILGLEL